MRVSIEVKLEQMLEAAPALRGLSTVLKYEVMWEFRNEVIRELLRLDPKVIFKKSSGALLTSISGLVIDDRLVFYSAKPHFIPQEQGVKPHTMWYLLGKTVPMKKDGETVFRKCTLKSIMRGGWRHPGYEGKQFLQACIDGAMSRLPNIISARIFSYTGVLM